MKPLEDPRKEKFVQNLVKGMSQRQAYRDAYKTKAKDSTCDVAANKLLKEPKPKQRLEYLMRLAAEKAERREAPAVDKATDIGAEIINGWKKILRASPLDFVRLDTNNNGKTITVLRDDLEKLDGFAIQEISTDSAGNVKLKLYSKAEAMKALAELYEVRTDTETHGVRIELPEEMDDFAE